MNTVNAKERIEFMNNINYDEINEITVHNQAELDDIPLDFMGRIYIDCTATVKVANRYYLRVEAYGSSSVVARESSSVVANANVQVVNRITGGKIKLSGNAREVFMPITIFEFMDFYGIKHTKTKATFYKAVHKAKDNRLFSDHNITFEYVIGEYKSEPNIDTDVTNECGCGIHISTLNFALNFAEKWDDLVIIKVETKIDDIILPQNTDGKVRTSKIKVLEEIPLEECGVYGKILAKYIEMRRESK